MRKSSTFCCGILLGIPLLIAGALLALHLAGSYAVKRGLLMDRFPCLRMRNGLAFYEPGCEGTLRIGKNQSYYRFGKLGTILTPSPPSEYTDTVLLLGNCWIMGFTEGTENITVPAITESILNTKHRRIRLVNASMGGGSPFVSTKKMGELLAEFKPSLVIYFVAIIDPINEQIHRSEFGNEPWVKYLPTPLRNLIFQKSYVMQALYQVHYIYNLLKIRISRTPEELVSHTLQSYEVMSAMAKRENIPLYLVESIAPLTLDKQGRFADSRNPSRKVEPKFQFTSNNLALTLIPAYFSELVPLYHAKMKETGYYIPLDPVSRSGADISDLLSEDGSHIAINKPLNEVFASELAELILGKVPRKKRP